MAVVKKYCHRLFMPRRGDNQIDTVISIDVPRLDQEPARRGKKVNRLSSDLRKAYLDRIIGTVVPVLSGLNAGEIWTTVAIEIGDCKG